MNIAFSLVIPAYNEAERLPPYLESACAYLAEVYPEAHEVLVVDDGSTDGTQDKVAAAATRWPAVRLVCHSQNQGKGAAVRTGMLAARGEVRLFADADGATPIGEHARLRAALDAGADVVVGSRRIATGGVHRQRYWVRSLASKAYAALVRCLAPVGVRDSMCGFKMFRAAAAEQLFALSRENGYMFDLELLVLAEKLGFRVSEVGVNWTEIPGSKLHMSHEWRRILAGAWRIRRRRLHGDLGQGRG